MELTFLLGFLRIFEPQMAEIGFIGFCNLGLFQDSLRILWGFFEILDGGELGMDVIRYNLM